MGCDGSRGGREVISDVGRSLLALAERQAKRTH
jgi:hypothetical protein